MVTGVASLAAFAAGALGVAGAALLRPEPVRGGQSARALPRLLGALGGRLRSTSPPEDLGARIVAAGSPLGLGVREVMAAKLAAGVGAGVLGLALATTAPGRLGALVAVAAPVLGFLSPDAWLVRRASDRARRVRRALPGMLDLLRVTVDAGSSLPAAIGMVGGRTAGPLATEWRVVAERVALGVPLADALGEMTRRVPLAEVRALVAALDRARRHGAPLGATLAAQSRDARLALSRRVREQAARAGPKIQLVVALLLVPSVLLLVAAALAAALLDPGGGGLPIA